MAEKEEIKDYIQKNLNKGYRMKDIRQVLCRWYSPYVVDEAIKETRFSGSRFKYSLANLSVYLSNLFKLLKLVPKWVFYSVFALIIILIAIAFLPDSQCKNIDCFINKANNCEKTFFEFADEGIVYSLKANDCIFTKEITTLPETEPQVIKDTLLNKKLTCNYGKGEFNSEWVNSLLGGLEDCDGELKTGFYEIAISQMGNS